MSVALSSATAAPASATPRVAYPVDEKRRKLRIAIVTGEWQTRVALAAAAC
jgi:hypothetical protein